MKKMLTSVWFAVAIGLLGFMGTMGGLLFLEPAQTATAPDPTAADTNAPPSEAEAPAPEPDPHAIEGIATEPIVNTDPVAEALLSRQVAEPGALTFNNPEVTQLLEELRREREALRQKEQQLKELQLQIALEKSHIGSITQEFLKAKALIEQAMTNRVTVLEDAEGKKLQELAKIYTNMPPANAVAILDKMSVDDVARILEFMKEREKAAILENFATNTLTKETGKATEISERLRRLGPPANLPNSPQVAQ